MMRAGWYAKLPATAVTAKYGIFLMKNARLDGESGISQASEERS